MDENTVFQNPNLVQQPPQQPVQPPQAAPPVSQPPINNPTPPSIPEDDEGSFFSIRTIIKLLLGLVVVVIILAVILNFVFAKLNENKNKKVTLTYWGLWEDSRTIAPIISEFQKQYPNITINYSKQDIKQYRERLVTRIKNGTGPDIYKFHNSWFPMLSSVLLPLPSDVITKDEFSKSFYEVCQKDLIRNGAIYGVPLSIDTLALYVNGDLLKNVGLTAPTDWIEFMDAAKSMTVKDENNKIKTAGAALGTFNNISHAPDIVSLLLLQNGANLNDLSSTEKSAADALNFYTSFAKGENSIWDETLDQSTLSFARGELAMFFGYSWDYFTIKTANPNLNFQIVPVPQLSGKNVTLASYWADGVSVKSKYQKEAFLFLKFLNQNEALEKFYAEESKIRSFGEPYAKISLGDKLKDNGFVYPFIQQAKYAQSSFFVDSTFDNGLNAQMNTYLGNAINSVLGNTSSQTAVETLSKGVEQVNKQYGQ